jgi:hypothetical protein
MTTPPDYTRAFLVALYSDRVPLSVFGNALRVFILGLDPNDSGLRNTGRNGYAKPVTVLRSHRP